MKFLDCITLNPKISLEKGKVYPFVEMANISTNARIPVLVEGKSFDSGVKFQDGDTVIARITPCLQNGKRFYCKDIGVGFGSTEYLVFRPKNDLVDNLYLYYYMKTEFIKQSMINSMTGATGRQRVNSDVFNDIKVDFPDIETQKKIGQTLSAYDDLIENNQKQIKLLEEAAQRLYKEWFVDFRFPGYEDTKFIDGIPDGWFIKSILDNEIFIFAKNGVSEFEGEKQYYATADITGTTITTDGETITFANKPSRAAIQPLVNSVWFARMSNTYKISNCYGESSHLANDSIISSGFAGFTSIEGCYGFVYATIASKKFDDEKNRHATGATQVSLTNDGLKKIEVLIPTINIAKQYSAIVECFMSKCELLKKSCKLLQQARDRLLPKLMSGEIEV